MAALIGVMALVAAGALSTATSANAADVPACPQGTVTGHWDTATNSFVNVTYAPGEGDPSTCYVNASSYTIPQTWDGKGFNITAIPQSEFAYLATTLTADSAGVSIPLAVPSCGNYQIDLYTGTRQRTVAQGGTGLDWINPGLPNIGMFAQAACVPELTPPAVTNETCSEANTPQNGSISVTETQGITYYYVATGSENEPTLIEKGSVSLPAGTYTVTAVRGDQTVKSWDVTIAAATCTTTNTPPTVTTPGSANPQAEAGATCTQAQVELKNLTPQTTDLPATFQVAVTGEQPKTFTVEAGETETGSYTPKSNPYTVTVTSEGKTLATATTSHLSCVEAVVIPGAKPPAVEPAVIPAELPHTGAVSLPLALAGAGLLLLGTLLVASTRRRRGDLAA